MPFLVMVVYFPLPGSLGSVVEVLQGLVVVWLVFVDY